MLNETVVEKLVGWLGRLATGVPIKVEEGVPIQAIFKFYKLVRSDPYLASLFAKADDYGVKEIVITKGGVKDFMRVGNTVYMGVQIDNPIDVQEFLTHEFVHHKSDNKFYDEIKTDKDSLDKMQQMGIELSDQFLEDASLHSLMTHARKEKDKDELAYYFYELVQQSDGYTGKSNYLKALELMSEFDYGWDKLKKRKFVNFRLKPLFGLKPSIAASKDRIDTLVDTLLEG